jgi:hypothetical protein
VADVLLLQLLEAFGLYRVHAAIKLLQALVGRSRDLQGSADIGDTLALVVELLSGVKLADDLLGCVALAFHGASPGQVWPAGKLSLGLIRFSGSMSDCYEAKAFPSIR